MNIKINKTQNQKYSFQISLIKWFKRNILQNLAYSLFYINIKNNSSYKMNDVVLGSNF